eukprot:Pgem_evm2s6568
MSVNLTYSNVADDNDDENGNINVVEDPPLYSKNNYKKPQSILKKTDNNANATATTADATADDGVGISKNVTNVTPKRKLQWRQSMVFVEKQSVMYSQLDPEARRKKKKVMLLKLTRKSVSAKCRKANKTFNFTYNNVQISTTIKS